MKKLQLGRTGIEVTEWCLGTMTYGNQTPEADAHEQLDRAVAAGIDFVDCAEMYPVNPVRKETCGRSEEILGTWLAKPGNREKVVVATKIAGPGNAIRGEEAPSAALIPQAVEASLKRLRTDVIDLYQIHWPTRGTWAFRRNWGYDPSGQDRQKTLDHMAEVLEAVGKQVAAGKIRAFGLSNETAWGTTKWVDVAAETGGPRVASIQNEYSLLCRLYDTDLAEVSVNEDVTLLSFSPLAAGLLTGKYQDGAVPEASRMALNGDLGGRKSERVFAAVQAYLDLAAQHGLDPVHMAMAWQRTRPFPVSAIFGATSVAQLDRILAGRDLVLSDEVIAGIDAVHKAHPLPY